MRIGLLGTLAVHDEAGRPVRVGGSMVRMLLIVLALDAGRVVPTYALIEQLWDDDPPGNAANALQSLVSRLRSALRQGGLPDRAIESHPAGYRLAVSPQDVDAVVFDGLARQGNQALAAGDAPAASRALREALDLWRGPALADASGTRFAAGPAARLEELRTRAALDLVEAGLALGEGDSLIGELRALIAADPVAERPRGLLMRALYAAGRQAEAVAVYTEARDLLASELGVDPSAQLEQIYLGVLRQDLPEECAGPAATPVAATPAAAGQPGHDDPPAPRPARVRKPLTSFVGRDEDLTRVVKMLAEGRLVTLTGPGGTGKTRLATEIAARLTGDPLAGSGAAAAAWPAAVDPVWFVELTPVSEPGEVASAVLSALGIRESPVIGHAGTGQLGSFAEPVQRLVTALAGRRDLLILDNCEHVVAAAAELADQVLAACPGVRVLATSREPLRITGEVLWPVPPLPVPPDAAGALDRAIDEPSGEVAGYAAVRLLADRAAAVRPGFRVDQGNAADVTRICRALDGMPLAIELAAARLRTLSAAQLAERLNARFELLTGGSRTAAPRHQTLRAVVAWSWELLSEPEQVLARRLATFPGGATLAAAEQVCQDAALPASMILPALFGLVEKSFLTVDDGDEPRYRMLETIRAYCTERLAEAGEEDPVRRAFAGHFLRLAETADPQLRAAGQHTWMRRLTAEQDNMHTALRWTVEQRDAALAVRFGQALGWFWLLRGQRRESGAMAREILAVSEPAAGAVPAPDVVRARAVCALTTLNATWDIAAVRQPLTELEWLLTSEQDGGSVPHPLVVVGAVMLAMYDRRDPDEALGLLTAQFESADPWTRSGARLMYAFSSLSLGRIDQAVQMCAEALAGFVVLGDRWGAALALVGQADLSMLDGEYAQAIASLDQAVGLSRELTDWEDTAQMYASLARARGRLGDFRRAQADLARAERVAREQGESENDLWIAYVRGELAWLRGDLAEARRLYLGLEERLASMNSAMVCSFQAMARGRAARAGLRSGADTAAAWAAQASALRLAADSQDRSAVAVVVDGLAATAMETDGGRASAERASVMLGAAHSMRGAFDHSSIDAPGARNAARQALGEAAFEAAYRRGLALDYQDAVAFAEDSARSPVSR